MIKTLNGIIPINLLLNGPPEKENKLIKISILSRRGRTSKWTLSNNQPRMIHKRRKIFIQFPPLNIDTELHVGIIYVSGLVSDKACYLLDNNDIISSKFIKKIPKNTKIDQEYYIKPYVDLTKYSTDATFKIIISIKTETSLYVLHEWYISPVRSHKWESTQGILQNNENIAEILIPVDFLET